VLWVPLNPIFLVFYVLIELRLELGGWLIGKSFQNSAESPHSLEMGERQSGFDIFISQVIEAVNMFHGSCLFLIGLTLAALAFLIIGLIVLWIIISIPVYFAGKLIKGGRCSLGNAMVATLFGPLVYFIVFVLSSFLLGVIIGKSAHIWAILLAFLAWLGVYKSSFKVGWVEALGIAVLAIAIFVVIGVLIGSIFNVIIFKTLFPFIG